MSYTHKKTSFVLYFYFSQIKHPFFCISISHKSSISGMQRLRFKNTKIQVLATHLHNYQFVAL